MKVRKLFIASMILMVLGISMACSGDGLRVGSVYCENGEDPAGVPTNDLRFSWKLESGERNVMQTAYRLVLADGHSRSFGEEDLLWDSGRIPGSQSILVPCGAPPLEAGNVYCWKVKVWDNRGNESPWSRTGSFISGLESEGDWNRAEWIGFTDLDPGKRVVPGIHLPGGRKEWKDKPVGDHLLPILRREFSLKEEPEMVLLFVSGLGQYELHINGENVGDQFLAPGWTHYDAKCLYNTYDVTDRMRKGTNCLGIMLGNGFYIIPNERYRKLMTAYGNPNMILMMNILYKDGSSEVIKSDEDWRAAPGPLTFSSIYGGENYNATLEIPGWDKPGFNDARWRHAMRVKAPSEKLLPEKDYPIKVEKVLEPVSVRPVGGTGGYLYDFGQNASGIIELKVSGNRGDTVRLVPAELIRDNLEAEQRASGQPYYWLYVLKGEGTETWSPKFTYYGFRYVQVEGAAPDTTASSGPKIGSLKMLHTRNSSPVAGEFHTSFELFNRINSLILWAIRSNLQSVVTDCPHREKLGWLEQTYLMGEGVHYNFDIYHLYNKVIDDMIDAQTEEGLIPGIAPEYTVFGGAFRDSPEWGSASVIIPWQLYRWYGDTTQILRAWDMMTRYVDYLEGKSEGHILSHGLGDWYDLGPERPGFAQLTPISLTATAIYYYDLVLLERMARVLGRDAEEEAFAQRAREVREAFNGKFFDPVTGTYSTGSQTAMSMPLVTGLVPESDRERVLANLVDSIVANGKALTAGDVGYHFLVRALQDGGAGELLYEMNARDDVPGYGFQLKKGATALTESWSALRIVSNNHMMLGHLMEWFYGGLAGIRQTEQSLAYSEIQISPQLVGGIESASAGFESPYGKIVSKWHKTAGEIEMEILIPANARAVVHFPVSGTQRIREGNSSLEEIEGLEILSDGKEGLVARIGSGRYRFVIHDR
jgi:alpha-L-rhamnosidase